METQFSLKLFHFSQGRLEINPWKGGFHHHHHPEESALVEKDLYAAIITVLYGHWPPPTLSVKLARWSFFGRQNKHNRYPQSWA